MILLACGEPAYEIQDSTENEVGVQIGQVPWMVSLGLNKSSGDNLINILRADLAEKLQTQSVRKRSCENTHVKKDAYKM
jgi:hypothetical protein